MPENTERRQFQRISFDAPVELTQGSLKATSEVIDISLKGILVKSISEHVNLDQPIHIHIHLSEEAVIVMTAVLTHQQNINGALAFRWTQVDIESMSHLRRLLELNTGNADLIDRELNRLGSE
jgi:hypothetical protein